MPKLTRLQFLQAAAAFPLLLTKAQAQPVAAATATGRERDWTVVYSTDFVHQFEVSDTGIGRSGEPCWRSDFPYGGRVVNNGELGIYADPEIFPGTEPFPVVDGQRRLRSQRLAKPIEWKEKSYAYSAALLSASHLPIGVGDRVECRLSLPHVMRKGYWPGFWLLPIKNARERDWPWPPEIDVIEWWLYNEGDRADAFWNSLHSGTPAAHLNDARQIALSSLGISGDLKQMLTYAVEITDQEVICFVDDREVSRRPNPAPHREWYSVLTLAVSGDPWPGAPGAKARFPQEVVLERFRILRRA